MHCRLLWLVYDLLLQEIIRTTIVELEPSDEPLKQGRNRDHGCLSHPLDLFSYHSRYSRGDIHRTVEEKQFFKRIANCQIFENKHDILASHVLSLLPYYDVIYCTNI